MTKMTKTQRTAILEAHNAPTVGVDEYFSRGYVHATRPTLAVMRRNGWVTEGRYNRQAPVTTAGLIAAGMHMDAIHAKAIAENTLRNADVDLCVAIADERRRLSVSGFRNVDLMALNNVMDAIHGEAIREDNVRDADAASAEQLHPSYKLFNRAVREGRSYRAAMDILHAEAIRENNVRDAPARPRNAGPRIWIDSGKRGDQRTVNIMLTGTDMDVINLIDQLNLLIHDRQDMPAVTALHDALCDRTPLVARTWPPADRDKAILHAEALAENGPWTSRLSVEGRQAVRDAAHTVALEEHRQRLYGRTHLGTLIGPTGIACNAEFRGMATSSSPRVADVTCPDCLAAFRRPRVCHLASPGDQVAGCGASVGSASLVASSNIDVNVTCPECRSIIDVPVDMDAIHAEALAFELIMYGETADRDRAKALVEALREDDGGWGQPDGMLDTTEVQRTHDQIREEAFRAVRLPAYCGSDWAHELHGGCGGSTVDMPSPPVANTPAEARTGTPDRVAAALDELAALHRDAHKLHLDVLTGRVNRIASILRGEGGV